ncbi:hypothetical protein SERLA73DRAFT_105932 [Serpula lacrymans var. lacrymans S7.3]|uniref:Conidiation-specific protein 6 n=2 Tax=Serpula lacrymans var. lacrymans TaxID=341189 RepID=F8PSE9_SERL3|nr:uncharacterized protein SERLADRAFT_464537 [Serpula lacrymans var. lacrymans S7.9]EGO01279.1 hypothetical protein SERLA73DRAFT_105932 [Serpula lacrymans var. lacrymans S7.3]EGO26918.1 hypothetical protein SERLADRAFT_464537 [Serpula lacrymans var. lacrymans S7.9]
MQSSKNTGNVAGGHKAAVQNPNVSSEAKEHSQNVLEEMGSKGELPEQTGGDEGRNPGNIVGGHKATLKNPNVSEEAKQHSKKVLDDMDV